MVRFQQCCNGCWNYSLEVVMNGVTNIEGCKHGKINRKSSSFKIQFKNESNFNFKIRK
jgi:hypothetical protein